MIHQGIPILHSISELLFQIYLSYMTFFIFPCIINTKIWQSNLFIFSSQVYFISNIEWSFWGSDFFQFSEFINIVFIFVLHLYWVHYIVLYFCSNLFCSIQRLYDFSDFFNKFSKVLPAFNCAKVIGNLWSICLGFNIFKPFPYFLLYLASDTTLE